jgi:hypothetical protein
MLGIDSGPVTTAPQGAAVRDTVPSRPRVRRELSSRRRRLRRRAGIAAGCLLAASAAAAQQPKTTVYSAGDGLPSSIIYDLDQDPSGRLWILSRGGVSVYDGATFVTHAEGLPSGPLGALTLDAGGRAWTVTLESRQPFVFDGGSWQPLPEPPAGRRPDDWATELAAVGDGADLRLVVGTTASGLLLWDGASWHQLTAADGLPDDRVNDLALSGDRLFVATDAGPCVLSGFELDCRMRQLDPRLRRRTIAVLPAAGLTEGRGARPSLWILGAEWMGQLEGDVLTVLVRGLDLRSYDVSIFGDLAVDEAGGIFFGSPSELYHLGPERGPPWKLGPRQGLAANGTTALLRDRESNLWIGSLRGLSKISSQRFLSYGQDQGLLENEVSAIAEAAPGRLVFGHEGGLTFLDGDRVETLAFPRNDDPHPELGLPALGRPAPDTPFIGRQFAYRVLDVAVDRGGEIWLAAHDLGLARVTAGRELVVEPLAGRFFSVEVDPRGRLWAASQKQLFVREGSRFVAVDCGFAASEVGFYRWLHAGGDGRFYLATRRGLLWQEADRWRRVHGPGDQADNVYNVLAESDGTVWAATSAGLYRLAGERLVQADLGGQTVDQPAYLLLRDPDGRLWIGTDDGVIIWDRRRLRQLTIRHGLSGRETNRGAGLVDSLGQVWIGTEQGASVYRERYDRGAAVPPGVELRSLEVGGEAFAPAVDLELRHDQDQLFFDVGTIGFDDEEPVRLRYRLDGLDDDWRGVAAASSEIRFSHLAPGRYRLRVAAARGDGPWSREATSGTVIIAEELPVVEGERTRLLEVMQNLIENAVKFLGDQPRPKIEIGVRPGAAGADVILVRDNGIGIEPHYHDKVFGLFDRLDPRIEGTGVGLAIVQRIVELHGGRIWVESEGLGRGATFCFTLPGGER